MRSGVVRRCVLVAGILALPLVASGAGDAIGSMTGLVSRLLGPEYATAFALEVIDADPATGHDVFELDFETAASPRPIIRGNSGVSLASGLHWYLKYTLNASIAWGKNGSGNQLGTVPAPMALPAPSGGHMRQAATVHWRYAFNVCTFGYSFVWYDLAAWTAEIDRLALWGVNLPLGFFIGGQEKVTREMFIALGLSTAEVDAYISGPAFLPWQRMGNMQGWGGPAPAEYWERATAMEVALLKQIRGYGMVPVLPGFSGHVPSALPRVYPNASYTNSADWCGFPAPYGSDTFLEPNDPLYVTLGTDFNTRVLALLGDPSGDEAPVFNADQFNEMDPNNSSEVYLAAANAATYQTIQAADNRSTYLMQGWLFHSGFWNQPRVSAYLSGVPPGKLLVLDLNTESGPVYQLLGSTPWLWNALLVFGGRRGIYGSLDVLALQPYADRAQGTMVGYGITPEAIDQSFVQFDLFWEAVWRDEPVANVSGWLDAYAGRRYGVDSDAARAAWAAMYAAALNADIDEAVGERYPTLNARMSQNTNATALLAALRLLVAAAADLPDNAPLPGPYSYDLTDLTRQVLWNVHSDLNGLLSARYTAAIQAGTLASAAAELGPLSEVLLDTMAAVDRVCSADQNFLLGQWSEAARAWANTSVAGEDALLVNNALNQITLWGPSGQINDYAAKNGWAGLVGLYYMGRWALYTEAIVNSTKSGVPPDWSGLVNAELVAFEQSWVGDTVATVFPTAASGESPVALAQWVLDTFASDVTLAADYDAYPGVDAIAEPPQQWVEQPAGHVAVGPDCPFIAQASAASAAECQAACAQAGNCNFVNVQIDGGVMTSCVLRLCVDPLHPQLTPYAADWTSFGAVIPVPHWFDLGAGVVAIGDDCPFVTYGPTDSLSSCQTSCLANAQCNAVNVETDAGTVTQCIFRQCVDALKPQLSPYPTDWTYWGANRTRNAVDAMHAWHTDPAVLAALCNADSACAGFNSKGILKLNVTLQVATAGTTLFVKKSGATPAAANNETGRQIVQATAAARAKTQQARVPDVVVPESARLSPNWAFFRRHRQGSRARN